jgi:hypothetical protein
MGFFSDIAPIATLGAGIMTGNPGLIAGGIGMLGSAEQGRAAQQGNQLAAQGAQFRPVGITNTFGTSNFAFDPSTGQLTSAGYTLAPELQAAQTSLMGNQAQNLQDLTNLQSLGRQYIAQSPQEAAQQYMANQQALLAPSRERESAQLLNQLSNTGRTGLSIAQGGGLAASNPEFQALANARAQQDLQLAAQAQQAGQQQTLFGQGLLSSAYQPYSAGLTALGATEGLGQQPLELSSSLAGRSATAGANAARYTQAANAYSPFGSFLSGLGATPGIGSSIGSLFTSPPSIGNVMPNIGSWYDTAAQGF